MNSKKDKIIATAEQLFARFGIQKTTMDEIAKNCRIGKTTLYNHFKSKDEIFAEVIRKDSRLFKQKLDESISQAETPQEKLRNYILTRMKHLLELSNYYTTLTDEFLEHYAFVEKTRQDFINYERTILAEILQDGIDAGIFAEVDVKIVARNFAIALKGLEYPIFVLKKSTHIENECNQMLNILLKGIETR